MIARTPVESYRFESAQKQVLTFVLRSMFEAIRHWNLFLVDSGSSDEVDHPLIARSSDGTESATGGVGFGAPVTTRLGKVDLLEPGPIKIRGATGVATETSLGSRMIGAGC